MDDPKRILRMPNVLDRMASKAPAPEREFLSRAEVARLFGVSPSTITRWARTGLVASIRTPGGHYRYRAKDALLAVHAAERGKESPS